MSINQSMNSEDGTICHSCQSQLGELDWRLSCSRCKNIFHHKCLGFDDSSYKHVVKIPAGLITIWCSECKDHFDQLDERVRSLESRVSSLSRPESPTSPLLCEDAIGRIVAKVVEQVLSKLTEVARDSAADAIEANGKKLNLVIVGLDENVSCENFVHSICDKIDIDRSGVGEAFRHGARKPDQARIVKVKFHTQSARRTFLTGFHDACKSLPNSGKAFVRPDLTLMQRQKDRELREELKRRRENGEEIKISRGKIVPKV